MMQSGRNSASGFKALKPTVSGLHPVPRIAEQPSEGVSRVTVVINEENAELLSSAGGHH